MKRAARSKTERRYVPEDITVHSHSCENLISTSKMRSVNSVLGVTLRHKIVSKNIRELVEIGNLIEEITKKCQRNSKEHAERMTCQLLPQKGYCYSITENRDRRPRRS
jgi:hypothetical protein